MFHNPSDIINYWGERVGLVSLDSSIRGDLIMNKNIYLVLTIIFIVLVVMGAWADWIECGGGMKEISDINDQAGGRIVLLNSIVKDEGESGSPPEVKIIIEEIDNGPEKQPYYAILVI